MTMQTYVDKQLRKLGGAGLYLLIIVIFVLVGRSLGAVPFFVHMGLGAIAILAGAKAYRMVTGG